MWRNGSGHKAVRSSGPRSHASGQDNAKKSLKASSTLTATVIASQAAQSDEAGKKKAELNAALKGGKHEAPLLLGQKKQDPKKMLAQLQREEKLAAMKAKSSTNKNDNDDDCNEDAKSEKSATSSSSKKNDDEDKIKK